MSLLEQVAHRPYPLPARPYVMHMRWSELAFLHWRVEAAHLQAMLPHGLELDCYENQAWLGVVPFAMEGTRARYLPAIPGTANFLELNVRTYVKHHGRPGVWFFSLDAESWLAVRGARMSFCLPYFDAQMSLKREGEWRGYHSERTHRRAPLGVFRARYRPVGPERHSAPGSLEQWLTERYCLYSADSKGKIYRGEIHHEAWPLQDAEVEISENSVASLARWPLEGPPELVHFVRTIPVLGWWLRAAERAEAE